MVKTKTALIASGVSAVLVGASHYIAHKLASSLAMNQQVIIVGVTVTVVTFVIAFAGMKVGGK